jgi:hypothetical protein
MPCQDSKCGGSKDPSWQPFAFVWLVQPISRCHNFIFCSYLIPVVVYYTPFTYLGVQRSGTRGTPPSVTALRGLPEYVVIVVDVWLIVRENLAHCELCCFVGALEYLK